ncbi:hypothetical protein [Allomuricauda sp. NBRC 101325]|uniref:hypothetical protein n=1 Tax=Allomuricauda sp. NBRC 101325 TaxID=1113758 RepID=UPI0024A09F5E|nr:hypothetical protein [Muricauda sp. NBRC 101325]GLU44847.1 hypothetical protein Musp01_24710 [Muricauda sp. NBRC 101325]
MGKILIVILFLAVGIEANGQSVNQTEIIGLWKVKRIVQNSSDPDFAPITDGFVKSTFTFSSSGDFDFHTTSASQEFIELIEMFNGTKWKFIKEDQLIRIGNEEDNFSILGINVKKTDGLLIFHLDESEIHLEMLKID